MVNFDSMLRIFLGFVLWLGFSTGIVAQVITNKDLLETASRNYRALEETNYTKALKMAKEKGWDLIIQSSNGRKGKLVGIDAQGHPKYYITQNNTIAAATTSTNQLWPGGRTGLNLSGSTAALKNKLALWDEGKVLSSHIEFAGRITQKDAATAMSDHATHVTGTLIASGVNPLAKGMAFGIQGALAFDFDNDFSEMFAEASSLLLSNHSYGIIAGWNFNASFGRWEFWGRANETEDYKFGFYSEDAQLMDSIAYNAPNYLMVKAAGNNRSYSGPAVGETYYRFNSTDQMVNAGPRPTGISSNNAYGSIAWDANAKNILTVGAVEGLPSGYVQKEDVVMTKFSSWGPTDDGRIKPDVVADGVAVLSTNANTNSSYDARNGTSHAAPNASGSLLLLQEYWSKLKAGAFMRSATLKGLAIHTADESGISAGPDYTFGWGLLNVEKSAAMITAALPSNNGSSSNHLIYENSLNNAQTFTTTVVATGKEPISATISWTDPKGSVETTNLLNNPTKKLVNDLDIRITKGTSVYQPWILDPSFPAAAATKGDNTRDNVEKVWVDSTVPGQSYTITITHKGSLNRNIPQAYSLLISGTGGLAYCASASTTTAGAKIDSVLIGAIKYGNPSGCASYTNATHLTATIETLQNIPITIKTATCGASTNARIATVYVDFNQNGVFETNEKMAQSAALTSATGSFTGSISTPAGLAVGSIYLMRVIVQETSNAADINACGIYGNGETADFRLRVVESSNDLSIYNVITPISGNCANDQQYVTVAIKNNGKVSQQNFPISLTVLNGSAIMISVTSVFKASIAPLATATYTFSLPFNAIAGSTYHITTTVNLLGDQVLSNNGNTVAVLMAAKPAAPTGTATFCNANTLLNVTNPSLSSNYFWYNTATATTAFATGQTVSIPTVPGNTAFYVGKEARGTVGPANKMVFPSGGYDAYSGNYINFTNTVPLTIETARLYIGNPGTIKFIVADYEGLDGNGGYLYTELASKTISVFATTPTPTPGAVSGNNASDTGAIFYLNLPVASTGNHIIIIECADGATIFRNNSISTNPYPFSLPSVISITGNSAATVANPNNYKSFYYFFYDMRVNTGDCISDRTEVVASSIGNPAITRVGDSLVSNIAIGNQWYLNDTTINGATGKSYKPILPGLYKTLVTDAGGCVKTSNTISFGNITETPMVLRVYPNPNDGYFLVKFETTVQNDYSLDVFSAQGKRIYYKSYPGFIGRFSKIVDLGHQTPGVYVVTVRVNGHSYSQKIIILN